MRIIDADELNKFPIRLNHYDKVHGDEKYVFGVEAVLEYAEYLPTIDPEDLRPKSEWILNKDGSGTCKRCRRTQMAVWDYDNWQNYCGHCGAKMEVNNG